MVSLIVMGHVREPNTRREVKNDACAVDAKTRVSEMPGDAERTKRTSVSTEICS
jgi:hypothetical protein